MELKKSGLELIYIPNSCLSIGNAFGNRSSSHPNRLKLKLKALFLGIVISK